MSRDPDIRILVVDDEPEACHLHRRILERAGYDCVEAGGAPEARRLLQEDDFALLVADVNMPGESGLDLARHVLAEHPATAAIMVTALDDTEVAQAALASGAYGYVIKPFTPNELIIAVANALRRRGLEIENEAHREMLRKLVRVRTAALARSADQLRLSREGTVRRFAEAVEYRNHEASAHTERMSRYAAVLAKSVGLDPESMRLASSMHDLGKVGLPDRILLKPGALTVDEHREMERHAEIGDMILGGSESGLLQLAATIALTHHEWFDGSGYPRGLSGDEIPIEGQIAAIADVFDALTSDRPYRAAVSVEEATEMMSRERGVHFNPDLLDIFFALIDEILVIRENCLGPAVGA
jgi:putative two-component system response regulator